MRAAYNTRSEPLRSSLRSCMDSGWPAGQRSVPSGCGVNAEPGNPCVKEGCAHWGGREDVSQSSAFCDVSADPAVSGAADEGAGSTGAVSAEGGAAPGGTGGGVPSGGGSSSGGGVEGSCTCE